ncbi:MAG: hypothetical protein DHS20C17_09280 [Cyclobacteriaceae bacterium]|nr:MAG: hypothetical protein DHS20C17_09280 [Cyclobacteriaceae bacterium]
MTLLSQTKPDFVIPEVSVAGESGILKAELVYSLDNRPTPQCHASTIVETSEGLLAAWFGGTHEKNPDVGIWTSINTHGVWSAPVEVANGIQNEDLRYPCWNPVLFQPKEGPLMLFYKVGPSPSAWWGMLITSKDQGYTWSAPKQMGKSQHGDLLGPIKNQPVQLEDGTIISPTSMEYQKQDQDFWQVYFEVSGDNGQTWTATDFINDGRTFDAIQPSVLSYQDGSLQVLCRSQQGVITQSWSRDKGKTWSSMTATKLPNPNSGTDAVTLSDGRQLLVYNHTTREGNFPNGRNMLNVALSTDGENWFPVLTLEKQQGEYSYPTVIQDTKGLVHITYTYQRQSVKYVKVDPTQLIIQN